MSTLDGISEARLDDTLRWVRKAGQEASDLALDAPLNKGLESLEEAAAVAADALDELLIEARSIRRAAASAPGATDKEAGRG